MTQSMFPILTTTDLGRSLAFYGDLLGGVVGYQFRPDGDADFVSLDLASKYKPGEVIADSPSVRKLEDQLGADLVGQRLDGRMVLEVPPQSGALPEDLIDFATKKQVSIRDSAGSWVLKVGP